MYARTGFWILLLGLVGMASADSVYYPLSAADTASEDFTHKLVATQDGFTLSTVFRGFAGNSLEREGRAFTRLSADACTVSGQPGQPELLIWRGYVSLPAGSDEIRVIEVEEGDSVSIPLTTSLYPVQPALIKDGRAPGPLVMDPAVYAQDDALGVERVSLTYAGRLGANDLWLLTIALTDYIPARNEVIAYPSLVVRVGWKPGAKSSAVVSSPFTARLTDALSIVPESTTSRAKSDSLETIMLFVPDAYASSGALTSFIDWKTRQGFNVISEAVSAGVTRDTIKSAISARYLADSELCYVILVGDTDTIPAWSGSGTLNPWSDLYYTLLDGTDWNTPDVGIGRLAVRTEEQLANLIRKILAYERLELPGGHEDWTLRASFLAGVDHSYLTERTHNDMITTYLTPAGYACDRLYTISTESSSSDVATAFNAGRGFVNYSGHGSETSWMDGPSFYQQAVRGLTNNVYPFVFSYACLTGKFTETECFGETWLRGSSGGAGYCGASESSYWGEDDILERANFDAMYTKGLTRIADFLAYGKQQVFASATSYDDDKRAYYEMYNILGDPTMDLHTGGPRTLAVTHSSTIVAGAVSFDIACAEVGARAVLTQGGGIKGWATASAGHAILLLQKGTLESGEAKLTVTAHNARVYEANLTVGDSGRVTATLEPEAVRAAGAGWRLDGGDVRASGDVLPGIAEGNHVLSFEDVPGWVTPADKVITVEAGSDIAETASYTAVGGTGSLEVTLEPSGAVVAGAKWHVDGGEVLESGATVSGLTEGEHQITCDAVAGWTTPAASPVVIVANETAHITLTYAEAFGTLRVVLNPAGAHNDGAQWRLDNGEWRSGGQDLISAQAGTHLLSFHDLSGWTKPADETIEIQAGGTLEVVREYAAVLGARTLQVNLAPAEAVLAGAQWSLDGTTWYSSGATITPPEGTAGGQHVIKFKSALGWIKPGDKIITVEAAEAKVLSYDYQRTTELLTVNIEPTEALLAGARWRLDGGEWQSQTGEPFAAAVGAHVISFEVLSGWTKPADAVFEIAAGEEKTVTGTYPTGVLNVQLTPQGAVLDGAKWRTDIDGELWRNSTTQPVRIPTGQHVISFKPLMSPDENILAWTTPADQYINLTADEQLAVAAVYEQGGLQVNIEPAAAVSEGAQWRVDGGAWHVTGYTISEISTGAHTLEFAPLDDWAAPTVSTVVVASGHTATTTARYRQGALSVSLLPEAAISLGARWKVGNRPWHASGETQDRLPAGDQIVTFDDLAGWDTPQPMTIRVEDGLTTPAVASYIQQFGGVRVTISPDRANTNLAQWRVDDGRWVFSGESVWNITVGIHTITFTPISGWQAEPIQVEVKKDALTEASGVYPTGRVTVAIVPDLAIQSGAKWSVAGGPLHNSGDTEEDVPAGSQTVTLTALAGWQAPAAISVEVIEGELIQILGRYPHGALQVTLTPPEAAAAGVTWSLDVGDGPWQASGTLLEVVPSGMHQILYSVAQGWARPLPASVEVLDGQIYNFESVAFAPAGDISVLIEPEGVRAAGAGWQIACDAWDCGETHASGDVLSGVPVGQREISFTEIPGWKTPDSVTIDVVQGANTAPLSASYIANSVTVNLAPAAAMEVGGMWRLDDGEWLAGGATASAVVRGEHSLEYRGINGWIAPPPETIFIADGDALTFSRSYAPFWASVRITINPEQARSEGAQWQVDGGSWQDSGATVGIGMGGHTVTFKPMDGWESPAAISFAPDSNGQVLTFEGTYSCAGMIGAPVNVKASDGEYDDRIVVTWDALPGASEYLVYRATDERVEAAGPVGGWVTEPKYEDFSAEPPKSSGCFGSRVAHNYYYYVVARNGKGCVSPVSNIDDGHAGDVN